MSQPSQRVSEAQIPGQLPLKEKFTHPPSPTSVQILKQPTDQKAPRRRYGEKITHGN